MQSVHITTNVVTSNPAQARCTRSSLCDIRWISPHIPVSSTNKTDLHDIAEILLKVALNTLTLFLLDIRTVPTVRVV